MPNYLAIDYGTKRIGLAWADDLLISLPVGAIPGTDFEGCWDALIAESKSARLPRLSDTPSIWMAPRARERKKSMHLSKIQCHIDLPVYWWMSG